MESNSWTRFTAASKRHQSTLQSRFDLYLGFDDVDGGGEDDLRAEFACPFCAEDFDIVGLCCHIDEEHPVEAKNGVCPVCAARVGMDMVSHITTQHGNFFKMQRRRRFRRGSSGSHSTLSLLRKELREGNLQSLFGGSSLPSNAAPDPLLSSFITNLPVSDPSRGGGLETLDDGNVVNEASEEKATESFHQMLEKLFF
ncbi:protein DEHYDRATION-INDUCED 19 homolog 2-like isoform X2 [Asparagus officinalis]|uniref:protein DEHYDRATION-INDUCED 19 homolog 2-like isoform X2 n=1 Tax=Asparagus officinalis TaxID=4686 RepID=UPI00098E0AA1|nr:protein DEHYDRATION-INDUCED 19 homolog 2-like isoform X2 [Asparagus officinalis]